MIHKAEEFVKATLGNDETGHDYYHADRVRKLALQIAVNENKGNLFIIEMAALLHDIPDEKLNADIEKANNKLHLFLLSIPLSNNQRLLIKNIINKISYRGGNEAKLTAFEEKAVRDADRLDAIGAIGIARTFAYGGKKGQAIYDPDIVVRTMMTKEQYRNEKSTTINHFYEKLLKLKDQLHTNTAKKMAEERHRWMESFLVQFFKEWNGENSEIINS
ncbi:HD domain-containing protein [Heyndrickxia sporothermodurans]